MACVVCTITSASVSVISEDTTREEFRSKKRDFVWSRRSLKGTMTNARLARPNFRCLWWSAINTSVLPVPVGSISKKVSFPASLLLCMSDSASS